MGANSTFQDRARFVIRQAGGVVTVIPDGELDVALAPRLRALFQRIADDGNDAVVDLSSTTFVDSMTIGVFLGAKRYFDNTHHSFLLRSPQPSVARVLSLTGIRAVVPVDESDIGDRR